MNSTKTTSGECFKCNGTGRLPTFSHIAAGVCFRCKGSGKIEFRDGPVCSAAVIANDDALDARRVEAICNADMSKWTFKQLHAARTFAVARIDTMPWLYDTWLDRGEACFKAKLAE